MTNQEQEGKWRSEPRQVWHSGKDNSNFKHGMKHSPEYSSWESMKCRCDNKNRKVYVLYGGRGIKYCEKWKDFLGFLEDMGSRPNGTFLDRIDNNKGYSKDNCRWAEKTISAFNKTSKISTGLPRGVQTIGNRFKSKIRIEKVDYHIGCFSSPKEASDAYLKMCLEWYGQLPPEN